MRARRHDPIAIPLGHVERPRISREVSHLHHSDRQAIPTIGHVTPDPVPHEVAVDYSALDRPTVLRRAESTPPGWADLDPEVRAEIREIAVAQIEKRLGDARHRLRHFGAEAVPALHLVERVARLERCLGMVRSWR